MSCQSIYMNLMEPCEPFVANCVALLSRVFHVKIVNQKGKHNMHVHMPSAIVPPKTESCTCLLAKHVFCSKYYCNEMKLLGLQSNTINGLDVAFVLVWHALQLHICTDLWAFEKNTKTPSANFTIRIIETSYSHVQVPALKSICKKSQPWTITKS